MIIILSFLKSHAAATQTTYISPPFHFKIQQQSLVKEFSHQQFQEQYIPQEYPGKKQKATCILDILNQVIFAQHAGVCSDREQAGCRFICCLKKESSLVSTMLMCCYIISVDGSQCSNMAMESKLLLALGKSKSQGALPFDFINFNLEEKVP